MLKVLLIYTLVSQLIVLAALLWATKNCDAIDVFEQVNSIQGPRKYLAWFVGLGGVLLLAPFILPWFCYTIVRGSVDEYREHKELFALYMEMQLDPIHPANLDDELLEHLETHSPTVMTNGFELLGDFFLKDEPFNSKARIFLNSDQTVFAEIGTTMETQYIELISFLEGGEYASTCSIEEFPKTEDFSQHGMHVNAVGSFDFDLLLQSHLEFLGSVSEKTGEPVRRMDLPRWKDYYHYHNHKYGQARFELGEIAEPPESCVFPPASGEGQREKKSPVLAD